MKLNDLTIKHNSEIDLDEYMRLRDKVANDLEHLDWVGDNRGYKYAVSTVSPDNNYSTNNFLLDGFSLVNTREFRRGIRSIYIKKIGE